jgi:transcriptional regulator with XRE-family HTH domain
MRAAAGLNGKEVAELLGWSASKVSRIETSRTGISPPDLERLLDLYRVGDDLAGYLRKLAPSAQSKGWWDAYADALSSGYTTLIKLEAGSRALQCYCSLVPHALLQTSEYSRQVILSTDVRLASAELDRRVQVLLRRQDLLTEREGDLPLQLSAVIDEAVLRRPVRNRGAPVTADVLRKQLHWLVEMASRPNVRIQVLPFAAGLPPATAGSFAILESLATETPDVVYFENKTRVFYIESGTEVLGYVRDYEQLTKMALAPADSIDFIAQLTADA